MKKKILIIIYQLKIGGGAERVFSNLTIKLSEKYDVSILTLLNFKDKYPFKGDYYSLQENLHSKTKFLKPFNLILRFIKIYKLIKKISPDIIITSIDLTNIFIIFTKFIFRIKVPLIISVRNNPKKLYKTDMKYLNLLIRIAYSSNIVNKIVTVSEEINDILEKAYGINRNRLKTIYNGIEIENIKKKKQKVIDNYKDIFDNEEIIKFITIGRLVEQKGHRYLIEAFSRVRERIIASKLIIIGEGPLRSDLERLINEMALKNDVYLLGIKRNPYKYLGKSDIFILPSLFEGLPNVMLEALTCGLPVISTNCKTGPKEILEDGKYGFLVNVKNANDLAEKMILLANDKNLLNEFSKKSFKRAEYFDSRKIINEWINLIESHTK